MNPLPPTVDSDLLQPLRQPDSADAAQYAHAVQQWFLQHWATLPDQHIGRSASRTEMEALLREPPPEQGTDFRQVLADFDQKVAGHAFRVAHPRFLAFIPGAPTFESILGDWLCAASNFFAGVWLEASGPSEVELVVLDWFKEFIGYPSSAHGIITGGGSEATLTAFVVARERLSYAERAHAVLYGTEQRHWSVDRAAKVIGLRPDQVRSLATNDRYQLLPGALAEAVQHDRQAGRVPWLVLASAGTTNTGTVDPLADIAEVCARERLWLHVDAAYGWPAVLTPQGRQALAGIERADSLTLDPHKWFAQTFGSGCLLVRDGPLLPATFAHLPVYMQDVAPEDDEINFADHGLALTRRFRALKIWLSLKVLGVAWFRELIDRCCRLARYAEVLLNQSPDFEVLCAPQLSVICFRYLPARYRQSGRTSDEEVNRLNLAIVEALCATGRAFLSSTKLHGQVSLRFCFVNWRTTAGDVEEVVQLLDKLGRELTTA